MKIKCEYCNTYIDDSNANCPNCGAPCSGVKRTAQGQPMTIEELKKWYADRHLPSSEVTRFFIGEDYKGPRAFGIYKEKDGKNFVVYKNKADGERAVRYRGTDEAYAVNEILQRLKQEILQQKAAKQERNSSSAPKRSTGSGSTTVKSKPGCGQIGCLVGIALAIILFVSACVSVLVENEPNAGYYRYDDSMYYYLDYYQSVSYDSWYYYDSDRAEWANIWTDGQDKISVPTDLRKNAHAKKYYCQKYWSSDLPCTDVTESIAYLDVRNAYTVDTGYYSYGDTLYYHNDLAQYAGWYYFASDDNEWYEADSAMVPEELTHYSTAADYYDVDGWDSSTQATDFTQTEYYNDYYDYDTDTSSSWYDDDDDDYDWDWGSDDDDDWGSDSDWDSGWDSGGSDWDSDW